MTLLANKSGSQPETFGVLKQKLGKPNSWGFKQHFVSTTINQDQKVVEKQRTLEKKEKKLAKTVSVNEDDRNVDEKRGFVPSDVNDPTKREFLSQLSKRIFTEQRTQNLFSKLRVVDTDSGGNTCFLGCLCGIGQYLICDSHMALHPLIYTGVTTLRFSHIDTAI